MREAGSHILRKHWGDVNKICLDKFMVTIAGHTVPICNCSYTFGSDVADVLSEGYPFAAYFFVNSAQMLKVGLRSKKDGGADVAKISEEYGGGGHKNASGFYVKSLDDL